MPEARAVLLGSECRRLPSGVCRSAVGVLLLLLLLTCSACGDLDATAHQKPTGGPTSPNVNRTARVFQGSGHQWALAMVACLRRAGYDARVGPAWQGPNFVVKGHRTLAQTEQLTRVNDACGRKVGVPKEHPVTRQSVARAYRWELRTRRCLLGHGLPVSSPPSLDHYLATYSAGPWSAYDAISAAGYSFPPGETWEKINKQCPQAPPGQ